MTAQNSENPKKPDKPESGGQGGQDRNAGRGGGGGGRRPRNRQGKSRQAPPPAAQGRGMPTAAVVMSVLALLVSITALVGGYFIWQEVLRQGKGQDKVAETVNDKFLTVQQETRKATDHVAREMDSLRARLEETVTDVRRSGDTVLQAVEQLRRQMGRTQDGWMLAEVRYLMRIANQRLVLQRDVGTALAALEAADQRLEELSDPGYLPVRDRLAGEILQLKAVARPDIDGLALALSALADRVDGLKMQGSQYRPPAPGERTGEAPDIDTEGDWGALPGRIWAALRELVEVRHHDKPVGPMVAPRHEYFLYQNLRLQLEAARVALLKGEQAVYRAALAQARAWLEEYFDGDEADTVSMVAEIARLAAVELAPALPDISGSLRLLRQQMQLNAGETVAEDAAPASPGPTVVPGPGAPAADASPEAAADTVEDAVTEPAGP